MKLNISIDFDGVIYENEGDKKPEVLTSTCVPGALDFIRQLIDADYKVFIFTSRALDAKTKYLIPGVIPAIRKFLKDNGLEARYLDRIEITYTKFPCIMYIDDRAFQFKGKFPSLDYIKNFKTWQEE